MALGGRKVEALICLFSDFLSFYIFKGKCTSFCHIWLDAGFHDHTASVILQLYWRNLKREGEETESQER